MSRPHETIAEALGLRAWTLSGARGASPPASAAAWQVFLSTERCAAWIRDRGSSWGDGSRVMEHLAFVELQRILSARANLERISRWARGGERRIAVLKGGVGILRGASLDLLDVDLLASDEDAAAVAEFLGSQGFATVGAAAAVRLGMLTTPNSVQVEVHTAIPGLVQDPAVWTGWAHSPLPGLWQLSPVNHAWHLLHHIALQHTERRGRIRDSLLLAGGLKDFGPEERRVLEDRIGGHPQCDLLRRQMQLSLALAAGEVEEDPFQLMAAAGYALTEWHLRRRPRPGLALWMARGAISGAARRSGFPGDRGGATLEIPSGRRTLARLRRLAPGAERMVRLFLRRFPEWTSLPIAATLIRRAERAMEMRTAAGSVGRPVPHTGDG